MACQASLGRASTFWPPGFVPLSPCLGCSTPGCPHTWLLSVFQIIPRSLKDCYLLPAHVHVDLGISPVPSLHWCACISPLSYLLSVFPLESAAAHGGEAWNVFRSRDEPRGSARPLTRERSLPASCPLPNFRGPGPLRDCIPPAALCPQGWPRVPTKQQLGDSWPGTQEALGWPRLPGSGIECPVGFPALPQCSRAGRKRLMQSPPPSPRNPRGTRITNGL